MAKRTGSRRQPADDLVINPVPIPPDNIHSGFYALNSLTHPIPKNYSKLCLASQLFSGNSGSAGKYSHSHQPSAIGAIGVHEHFTFIKGKVSM